MSQFCSHNVRSTPMREWNHYLCTLVKMQIYRKCTSFVQGTAQWTHFSKRIVDDIWSGILGLPFELWEGEFTGQRDQDFLYQNYVFISFLDIFHLHTYILQTLQRILCIQICLKTRMWFSLFIFAFWFSGNVFSLSGRSHH